MGPILLKKITEELNATLRGGIISKIHQPGGKLLILKIFIRGRVHKLLIDTDACLTRMHLTREKYPNPVNTPRFCAFLRKYITGALIEEVRALEGQRIAEISLKRKNGDKPGESVTLVVELTGKSANIILIDSVSIVMDALKYFPPESSPRGVSPGLKLNPLMGKSRAKESLIDKIDETWNESADLYYSNRLREREKIQAKNDLGRTLKKVEKRLSKKVQNLETDITKAEDNIKNSKNAELLLANFKRLKRGMCEIEVGDYFESPPKLLTIKLDARLTANENIERLFKLAKKGKRTIEIATTRVSEVKEELEYLQSLWFMVEESTELDLVKDELTAAGYIKKKPDGKTQKKTEKKKSEPIERISLEDEAVILIGRSGIGNDLIVKKYARPGDLWFHAQNSPGAHVLLKPAGGGALSDAAITEAAGYAAGHSRGAGSALIEVIMAKATEVKRPKGAKPGMVRVAGYKSLMVKPKKIEERER